MNTLRPDCLSLGSLLLATAVSVLGASAAAPAAPEVKLSWASADVQKKLGSYSPQRLKLSSDKPDSLKKAPKDLKAPLYGELKMGPKESPATFLVVLDEPEGAASRLFVDANHNGDLTDDPAPVWAERTTPGAGGKDTVMYNGDVSVKIPYAAGEQKAHLFLYRFDKSDPQRGTAFKDFIFYYRDYALSGEVKLGEKTYGAMLVDETVSGDFRGAEGKSSGVRFLIDANEDGKFDARREGYDIRAPFNIGGTTYEIADLTAAGSFKIVKSSQTVEEVKPAPNLAQGAKAPAFNAKTTDGKERNFPGDYKGKVVLLDFWAIWCSPCVRELPNVVASYEKYHDQGFEILGISLDRADAEEKLASFTKEHKMPWPQVYDGKFWQARVGQLYGIQSIPSMLLIDGDTGEILAGTEARGPNLEPAIKRGLEKLAAKASAK
jgi:peroxiredoxin